MAKKSKTQRAKASAARQQRKAARAQAENAVELKTGDATLTATDSAKQAKVAAVNKDVTTTAETPKRSLFKKAEKTEAKPAAKAQAKAAAKAPKKRNRLSQFFHDVKAEMKRVTWPTRTDVLRWTGVVIVALLFFGIFTAVLDNVIVTPILFWISGF